MPLKAGMTLKARIIPCLDVKDGRVVKGVNFVDLIDAGDPVEAARACHAHGIRVMMGAPNLIRGGSHSGNVAAEELARAVEEVAAMADELQSAG